jgi:hypothetical protein
MTGHPHQTRRRRAADHDPGSAQDITDPHTGGSRVLSRKCDTCILRPGNRMHLGPGRLAELLARTLPHTYVVCHKTLTYGEFPEYGPAICRGFADKYGERSWAITLLRRCGRLVEVPPPGDDGTATTA